MIHAAGVNGGYPVANALFENGVDTVVYIHLFSEEQGDRLREENKGSLILTGHYGSDSLGINPLVDDLEQRGHRGRVLQQDGASQAMKGTAKEGGLVSGYSGLALRPPGPEMMKGSTHCLATFQLDTDVSQLFPYINAVADDAVYYEEPPFIKFSLDRFQCALHPDSGAASPFEKEGEAHVFVDRLIAFLNDLHVRRDSIEPSYKMYRQVSVLDVFRLLPRTNCKECGFPTCMAFAAAVSKQETVPARCPGFSRPIAANAVYPVYDSEGNLLSTVTLEIDAEPAHQVLQESRDYVEGLKSRMVESRRVKGADVEEANNALPAPLTSRELEVLRLVAQGATNAEIADLLEISPHTVKSHVIHIFNKLGVSDRTQAAVWAARNALV